MRKWLAILPVLFVMTACSRQAVTPGVTPGKTLAGTLRPYPSNTPTLTPLPTDYVTPTPSPTITPTWTPVYYTVKEQDDMFGIALRYGVSLEALKTANPTVLPNWMGAGMQLLIPLTPQPGVSPSPTVIFTPTPTALYSKLHDPLCYPDGLGGLTCFVLVENNTDADLENVGGVLALTDLGTGNVRRQSGIMLLNLLKADTAQPIIVYLEQSDLDNAEISFVVDVAFPVAADDTRYVAIEILEPQIEFSEDKNRASIHGKLQLKEGEQPAESVWILAVGYNSDGEVVGVRRWESQSVLEADEQIDFNLNLFSMRGELQRVDLLVEARRLIP